MQERLLNQGDWSVGSPLDRVAILYLSTEPVTGALVLKSACKRDRFLDASDVFPKIASGLGFTCEPRPTIEQRAFGTQVGI